MKSVKSANQRMRKLNQNEWNEWEEMRAAKEAKTAKSVNFIAAFCMCVLVIAALFVFAPLNGEQKIFSDMIRLHVLANSDSQADQDLKFKVRDYILGGIAELTENSADSREAARKIEQRLDDIESSVRAFIRSHGRDYEVRAVFSRQMYPRRIYTDNYADYIFPAGEYNSLSIRIGEAVGENWWCVLFPPLCFSSAMRIEETLAVAGYTDEQINLLRRDGTQSGISSTRFEVRLRILEIFGEILGSGN